MAYLHGPENKKKIQNKFHPMVVGIVNDGVTVSLEGKDIGWSTDTIKWSDWDRLVAWVEWRPREIAAP